MSTLIVAVFALLFSTSLVKPAIILTPHAYYACTGERIEFTCTATGTTALQWIIAVPGHTSENGLISSTQAVPTITVQISSSVFILSRISTTPLLSTLSVRSSPLLNGTLVRCSAGNSGTDMAFITTVDIGTPSPFQLSIRSDSHVFGESSTFVHLQWTQGLNKGSTIYSLESNPPLDETLNLLSNANVLLHISYNVRYNVTVTARNCEGSTNASIKLYFGKCEYPEVHYSIMAQYTSFPALNGSTATFYCPPGYVISGQSEAICNNEEWIPDPRNVECIADCGAPISNSRVSVLLYNSTIAGSSVTYRCKDGFLPKSIMMSECYANKSWIPNPALLFCVHHREDTCIFPSPPSNGAITNFSNTEEGTMITFQCNDGFTPIEEIMSTCLEDGTWEINPLTIICTAQKISGNEAAKLTSQVVTGIVAIVCFIAGIFLGLIICSFLYLKWYIKQKNLLVGINQDSRPDPMYEEVDETIKQYKMDLNENVSYVSKCVKDQLEDDSLNAL